MELSDRDIEELRDMLRHPGWKVMEKVFQEQIRYLFQQILQSDGKDSIDYLRGQVKGIGRVIAEPVKTVEDFARLNEERQAVAVADAWAKRAVDLGMSFAGFPGQAGDDR